MNINLNFKNLCSSLKELLKEKIDKSDLDKTNANVSAIENSIADILTKTDEKVSTEDLNAALENKVDKESGKGLSSNDYTTDEKNKLAETADNVACNLLDYNEFMIFPSDGKITITSNGDGTITVNGTADTQIKASFIYIGEGNPIVTKNTTYTLSGAPEGASETTYGLVVKNIGSDRHDVWCYKTATFNTENSRLDLIRFCIFIEKGQTVSNLTFKPMLEVGTIAHSFVPYTGRIGKINGEVAELKSKYYDTKNLVGNMYNLIDTSLISSATTNGIIRTNNNDGSITYTGISTATTDVFVPLMASKSLNVGVYVFKPNPVRTEENYYYQIYKGGTYWKELSIDDPIEIISYDNYSIGIAVKSGDSISNKFKPMLEVKRKLYNLPKSVGYTGGTGALNSDVAAIESRTKTTDWIDIPLTSDSTVTSSSYLKYKKFGSVVNIVGNITFTSDANNVAIWMFTLSENITSIISPAFGPEYFGITTTNQNGVYARIQKMDNTFSSMQIYTQSESNVTPTYKENPPIIGKGRTYQFSMTYLV